MVLQNELHDFVSAIRCRPHKANKAYNSARSGCTAEQFIELSGRLEWLLVQSRYGRHLAPRDWSQKFDGLAGRDDVVVRNDDIVDAGTHPLVGKRFSCGRALAGKQQSQLGYRAGCAQLNLPLFAQEMGQLSVRSNLHMNT